MSNNSVLFTMFLQLKRDQGRELCIVVTNLNKMCSEYFTYKTTPDLPIRDAVRMSMAFPRKCLKFYTNFLKAAQFFTHNILHFIAYFSRL